MQGKHEDRQLVQNPENIRLCKRGTGDRGENTNSGHADDQKIPAFCIIYFEKRICGNIHMAGSG